MRTEFTQPASRWHNLVLSCSSARKSISLYIHFRNNFSKVSMQIIYIVPYYQHTVITLIMCNVIFLLSLTKMFMYDCSLSLTPCIISRCLYTRHSICESFWRSNTCRTSLFRIFSNSTSEKSGNQLPIMHTIKHVPYWNLHKTEDPEGNAPHIQVNIVIYPILWHTTYDPSCTLSSLSTVLMTLP